MGLLDGFTSDGTVDMKHTEYYSLMREAAKADLIANAVRADVPGFYIQAMLTGEKPEFIAELNAQEENTREEDTGFHTEYEQITGAAVAIFEAWMKENGVESAAASMHRLIDTLAKNRIEELQIIKENQEEHNERMKEAFKEVMESMREMPVISVGVDFGGGKKKAEADKEPPCREKWSCRTCGHCKPVRVELNTCQECEDGSNYTPADDLEEEAHELAEDDGEGQQEQEESEGGANGNE